METKILQLGEGNFLRCFIDWMVQKMNDKAGFDGAVQIIQHLAAELPGLVFIPCELIALNTIAKWKTRCLPVVCDYYNLYGKLPVAMIEGYEAIARHYNA